MNSTVSYCQPARYTQIKRGDTNRSVRMLYSEHASRFLARSTLAISNGSHGKNRNNSRFYHSNKQVPSSRIRRLNIDDTKALHWLRSLDILLRPLIPLLLKRILLTFHFFGSSSNSSNKDLPTEKSAFSDSLTRICTPISTLFIPLP
jgi:hypothetical protein